MYQYNANEGSHHVNGSACSWNTMAKERGVILNIRNSNKIHEIDISKLKSMKLIDISVIAIFTVALTSGLVGHILKSWIPAAFAVVVVGCLLMHLHFASISKETLTIIPSLGVQISSQYATGRRVTKFIPFHQVQDIIIHEAVTMHKVVYYLAVLLRHQEKGDHSNSLVPVFLHSMPRLNMLRDIHRSVHEMLDFHALHVDVMDMDNAVASDR